ncbi:MAG TPA: hypothetical protein VF079_00550 [Sphingomicrobium sp.]
MILAALALLAAQATAAQPVAAGILLPADTPIQLSTVDVLDSRSIRQGQRFALRVSEDVLVGSTVVIPKGAAAVGEVEAVSGKGMVGKAGRLIVRPLFVDVAGERVNLVGMIKERGADSTTGVAVGSLLLSGWGLFITGKSASLPAGSPLPGRVRTDASIPLTALPQPAAPSAAPPAANKSDQH